MKNIHLNQQSWRAASDALRRWIAAVPYGLLIERFGALRLLLLISFLVGAVVVLATLLYQPAEDETVAVVSRPLLLQTDILDEMELWIEERQSESGRPVITGSRDYFKR